MYYKVGNTVPNTKIRCPIHNDLPTVKTHYFNTHFIFNSYLIPSICIDISIYFWHLNNHTSIVIN